MIVAALSLVLSTAILQPPVDEDGRPATVLLVTSAELAPSWERFAAWKTRLGKATKILTVARIDEVYDGEDRQARIRAAILDHIDHHGTRWVILGGDSEPDGGGHVPHRETPHRTPMRATLPTDLYYLSPTDWDADGDGVYGDWRTDREAVSYTNPRACIARIPLRTAADVEAYTTKVIAYETEFPEDGFAHRMLYTCPEPQAEPKVRRSWDDYVEPVWEGGEVARWFRAESPWEGGGDFDLTPEHWIGKLNTAVASKIHMHGHGHLPAWVLEGHSRVQARHVAELANAHALPIITTVSCNTGEFDASTDPSITESMLRAPEGGAIAIVAPSRPGVPVFSDPADFRLMMTEGKLDGTTETMTRFWVHGLSGEMTTGEAFAAVKADFAERAEEHPAYHFCECEINLLGDPTLDFRARPPRTPDITAPSAVAVGAGRVVIMTDAPGATVCLWKGDECYVVVTADEQGEAAADVELLTPGELLVTVSGPSLNAALASVEVQAEGAH